MHVVNVAPTIAISGAANVNEGSAYSADPGRGHRPGHRHRHQLRRPLGRRQRRHATARTAPRRTPTPTARPSRPITVDLVDEDGTFLDRANAKSVTVDNVAPTIAISGATHVNEGSAYTLTLGAVTDPGTDTVTSYVVHWGDGNHEHLHAPNGAKTHTYADGPASQPITVDLVDEDGTYSIARTRASSRSTTSPPTVTAAANQSTTATVSHSFTLGSFTDPGANDNPWAVDVDWGDATAHTPFTQATQGSLGSQSHTYAAMRPRTPSRSR